MPASTVIAAYTPCIGISGLVVGAVTRFVRRLTIGVNVQQHGGLGDEASLPRLI